jgi:DNA-binding transcriptional MerR regulator
MLIGEICHLTGLSRDTIRFYEKQGLIQVNRKDLRFNTYKEYTSDTLRRLLLIKRLKDFGFTLNEAAEYLELIENNQASCHNVSDRITQKILVIDQKIEELKQLRYLLTKGVEDCLHCQPTSELNENCPIFTSDLI